METAMNPYGKVEIKEGKGLETWLPCKKCAGETCHEILVSAYRYGESSNGDIQVWEHYRIVECRGCKEVSFLKEWQCSEDAVFDERGEERLKNFQEVYPSRIAGRRELENLYELAPQVRSIYQETHKALCNKQSILTGIGIRALVESVCKEKKAKGRNLKDQIDNLVEQGVLTKAGADFLHELRFLGNEAAHEVETHDENTLSIAMDIAENLLQNAYIIPKAAERLKKRKKKLE